LGQSTSLLICLAAEKYPKLLFILKYSYSGCSLGAGAYNFWKYDHVLFEGCGFWSRQVFSFFYSSG